MSMPEVLLYTGGVAGVKPGPGGWAYILVHPVTGKVKEQSGFETETTRNRMEVMAVTRGLESLQRPCGVTLLTDAMYVVKAIHDWMANWKLSQWRRWDDGLFKPVSNADLWQQIDRLQTIHRLRCRQVRAQAGVHELLRCDELAAAAYQHLKTPKLALCPG